MLCKGAALIVGYGRDPGARPMADVDVGGAAEPGTPCARDRDRRRILADGGDRALWSPAGASGPQPGGSRHRWGSPGPALDDLARAGRWAGGLRSCARRLPSSASRRRFPRRPTPCSACWPTGRASTPGRCAGCSTARSASGRLVTPWIGIASSCVPGITGSHGQLAIALDALRSQYAAAVPEGVVDALEQRTSTLWDRALWMLQCHPLPRGQRWPYLLNEWSRARREPYPGGRSGASPTSSRRGSRPRIWRISSGGSADTRLPGYRGHEARARAIAAPEKMRPGREREFYTKRLAPWTRIDVVER